ncbi:hypothetical protein [Glycomyces albidus]|uniref:hypothetical protein n=1 Tax=Glycomyces albidus TaxID=2656774 RepID=UPI00128FF68C|nr:hypothetical protein [Glycomyces albidus]
MPDTSQLRDTFDRITAEPPGEARTVALEALLEAVDAAGEQPLLNEVLAAILASYRWSEDSLRHLTAFARLFRNLQTAPEWFDEPILNTVYWWMHNNVERMLERPDVPLASIEEFIDRMHGFYAEAGRPLYPVHLGELVLAVHLGDDARTARALAVLDATEPDYTDDCEPCVRHSLGAICANAGDHDGAFALWEPILRGDMTCPNQPHATLAASLLPLVRLGELEQARANHLHGWRLIDGKDQMVLPFADHVRFCALTGNEARAVELLSSRPHLFTAALDPMFRLRLLESVQLTCAALAARGHGDAVLPGPDGAPAPAGALHDRVDAERREIGARFDLRNGNDVQSRRSADRVRFTGAHPHLPLGIRTAAARPPAPRPSGSTAADLERLLADARAASDAFAADRLEHWRRVGDLADRLGTALEPADEAAVLVQRLNDATDPDASRDLAERAAALLRKAGHEGKALSLDASTLATRHPDDPEALRAEAERLLDDAERLAADDPVHSLRTRTAAWSALAQAARPLGGEPDPRLREAIRGLDAELAARPGERGLTEARARLCMVAAMLAASEEEGRAAVRSGYELARAAGHPHEMVVLAIYHAAALRREGRFEEALETAEDAIAVIPAATPDRTAAALHFTAAETAVNLGRWPRAERYAVKAAHLDDRCGSIVTATAARHLAGFAMAMQERDGAAVPLLEAVLEELADAPEGEQWRAVDARTLLADACERLGDVEQAAEHALEALRLMDTGVAHPDAARYARTAHRAGELLDRMWAEEDAVLAFRRAENAWRELGSLPMAARSIRAGLRVDAESGDADEEAAAAAFAALEEELRADWRGEEGPPSYRDACRLELAETLLQHFDRVPFDHAPFDRVGDGADGRELLREALAVFAEGPFDDREVPAVLRLMRLLGEAGDAGGAAAAAARVLDRLDPVEHADHRKLIEDALAENA